MFGFNPAILEFLRRQQMQQQGPMPMPIPMGRPFEGAAHNPFGGGYKGMPQGMPRMMPQMPRMPSMGGMPGMAGGKRMMRRPY